MKKTFIYCDICSTEIYEGEGTFSTPDGKDICTDCMTRLVNEYFSHGSILPEAAGETVKMVPIDKIESKGKRWGAKKEEPQKPPFDRGKAQALRNNGWTLKQISEEMGWAESYICEHTDKPAPKPKKKDLEWIDDDMHRLGITDKDEVEELMDGR